MGVRAWLRRLRGHDPIEAGRQEAEVLREKEIQHHKEWLREHADNVILPGGRALSELIAEERAEAIASVRK